jgi:hypothetical protein
MSLFDDRSVVDDSEPFAGEVGDEILHRLHLLAGMARPIRELID